MTHGVAKEKTKGAIEGGAEAVKEGAEPVKERAS